MYSLVLATMLATGGEAPQFHHGWGCGGCWGCCGGCWGCCGGCWGCGGGCWGYGGWRGWQVSYGCWGNSCWGGYYSACYGCCGGCWGGYYYSSCYGCYGGCYGGYYPGPVGSGSGSPGQTGSGSPTAVQGSRTAKSSASNGSKGAVTISQDTAAKFTVRVPADAKLYIDGELCPLTSEVRTFNSPALTAGKKYQYTLEMVRDGGKKKESRQVNFEAGSTVEVDFNKTVVVQAKK